MNITYVLIYLFSVFISSCSQILLKSSANKTYTSKIKEYLNPKVIFAYGIFFMATLATVYAYKEIDLSFGQMLEASGYIWITFLGRAILKEKISKRKILGIIIVIIGIILYVVL